MRMHSIIVVDMVNSGAARASNPHRGTFRVRGALFMFAMCVCVCYTILGVRSSGLVIKVDWTNSCDVAIVYACK